MRNENNYIKIRLEEDFIYKGGVYHSVILKQEDQEEIGIYVKDGRRIEHYITAVYSWEVLRKVMRQLLHNDRRF